MIFRRLILRLTQNPLIHKNFHDRMHGLRNFILVTVHLVAITLVLTLAFLAFQSTNTSPGSLELRSLFGKVIFGLLIGMELVMISFVAPGITSSAFTAERERQTYDLLRMTLLTPSDLVIGKLLPGIGFIILLLFTAIPLAGPSFLVGGISWQEIIISIIILIITAVAFCSLGVLLSILLQRTVIASTLAYACAIFLVFGIPIILLFLLVLFGITFSNGIDQLSQKTTILLFIGGWFALSLTPTGAVFGTEALFSYQNQLLIHRVPVTRDLVFLAPSPWIIFVITYLSFSVLAIWLSIQLIEKRDI